VTEKNDRPPRDESETRALALLDDLLQESYDAVSRKFAANPKLGTWLRMLELRMKLTPKQIAHKELWKLLARVRRDVLDENAKVDKGSPRRRARKSAAAETQE